jgi:hypothetical protein
MFFLVPTPLAAKGGGSSTPATVTCGTTDITATSATILACSGFVSGNLLNQSNASADQQILQALGYGDWSGKITDVAGSANNLNGSRTVDFGVDLSGISIIGIHYGNGKGGPGQGTAFYVLDAAQGIGQIHLAYGASSNAILFATGLPRQIADVPEPASWMLMIGGFGLIGAQMRRRLTRGRFGISA